MGTQGGSQTILDTQSLLSNHRESSSWGETERGRISLEEEENVREVTSKLALRLYNDEVYHDTIVTTLAHTEFPLWVSSYLFPI
jgi:hypothetical protein